MEDNELIKRILKGDEVGLEILHKRYAQQIYHFIYTETKNYDDAEEILQDTFYKVATRLHQFRNRSTFKTWIYMIARNTIIDYYKKSLNQVKTVPYKDNVIEQNSNTNKQETISELQLAIEQLPINYRRVLHLRFVEEFSVVETAKIIGVSVLSVKSTQKRAKKMLRSQFGKEVTING